MNFNVRIDPVTYLGRNFRNRPAFKTFWWQVPIRASPLRRQFHLRLIFFHDFTQAKVCNLHTSVFIEQNVARFQIVVDNWSLLLVQILQAL